MALTKQDVRDVIDVYIKAWEQQDPDLIVTIFTPAATYHERVMEDPIPGREAIRRVLAGQGGRGASQHHVPPAEPVPRRGHRDRRMGGGVR